MGDAERDRPLTIGDLSERTGVPPATLRSWESRYGFPRPARLAGGHRRYAEPDVAAVLEVLRHRDSGLALEAAVRRATAAPAPGPPRTSSLYAELRRQHPALLPRLLSKTSLLALSRAIEDECCARAQEPLLFAGFQREAFLRASAPRWAELARTARAAVVFAEVDDPGPGAPVPSVPGVPSAPSGSRAWLPVEVPLPAGSPLQREWFVVCDAPDLPACMVAVERPGQAGVADARRRFETVWSVDPRVVRHAGRVAAALADRYRPDWRDTGATVPEDEPPAASADLRRAVDLLDRMMGYLDPGA